MTDVPLKTNVAVVHTTNHAVETEKLQGYRKAYSRNLATKWWSDVGVISY